MTNLTEEYYEKIETEFSKLIKIIYRLREPDGCPWDRAQTHESIRENVIEEAYELVDAIDAKNTKMMQEECGDVLLQAVFNGVIGEEAGEFSLYDMLKGLNDKLLFRHTHIFGEDKAYNPADALKFWEAAKAKEKGQNGVLDKLDSIPGVFPALLHAEKTKKVAKKIGYDFVSSESALDKVKEELGEYITADAAHKEEEGGDLLFATACALSTDGISPEVALNKACVKFETRFRKMVELIRADGKKEEELSLLEQEEYYQKAKSILNETK